MREVCLIPHFSVEFHISGRQRNLYVLCCKYVVFPFPFKLLGGLGIAHELFQLSK
jgi:hypothetical protein